jgi:hypothetical protein
MEVQLPYRTEQQRTEQNISSAAGAGHEAQAAAQAADGAGLGNGEDQAQGESPGESGTARVRRVLIEPLAKLARPRGLQAGQHADNLDRLARKLRHMDEAGLSALLDLCLGQAGGPGVQRKAVPVCPHDAAILAWAYALQPPPVTQSDYPASVMRSAMGRRAHDLGYGVELFRAACRLGPPPQAYSITRLKDEAAENRRRRAVCREAIEAGGRLEPHRQAWLDAFHRDALMVEQLIAEGDERRAARSPDVGDAA